MKNTINSDEDLLGVCYLFILEKMRQRRHQQTHNQVGNNDSDKDETGMLNKHAGSNDELDRGTSALSFQR